MFGRRVEQSSSLRRAVVVAGGGGSLRLLCHVQPHARALRLGGAGRRVLRHHRSGRPVGRHGDEIGLEARFAQRRRRLRRGRPDDVRNRPLRRLRRRCGRRRRLVVVVAREQVEGAEPQQDEDQQRQQPGPERRRLPGRLGLLDDDGVIHDRSRHHRLRAPLVAHDRLVDRLVGRDDHGLVVGGIRRISRRRLGHRHHLPVAPRSMPRRLVRDERRRVPDAG